MKETRKTDRYNPSQELVSRLLRLTAEGQAANPDTLDASTEAIRWAQFRLTAMDLLSKDAQITRLGREAVKYMCVDDGVSVELARVAVEARGQEDLLRAVGILATWQPLLLKDKGQRFRQDGDRGDLVPLLRAYKAAGKATMRRGGKGQEEIAKDVRLGTFFRARGIFQKLAAVAEELGHRIERGNLSHEQLTCAFLPGFADLLMYLPEDEPQQGFDGRGRGWQNISGEYLPLAHSSVLNCRCKTRIALPVGFAAIEGKHGMFLLATEALEVEPEYLTAMFPDRAQVRYRNFYLDRQDGKVKCDRETVFDGTYLHGERDVQAPPCADTFRVLAERLASGGYVNPEAAGEQMSALFELRTLSQASGGSVPFPTQEQLMHWLSKRQGDLGADLTLTFEDLAEITSTPDLPQKVEAARSGCPTSLTAGDTKLPVSYTEAGIEVKLDANGEGAKALPLLTASLFPAAWAGRKVSVVVQARNGCVFSAGIKDEDLDVLRRQVAVQGQERALNLPDSASNLLQEIEVEHPGRKEKLYLVAGPVAALAVTVTDESQARQRAEELVREWLTRESKEALVDMLRETGNQMEPWSEAELQEAVRQGMECIQGRLTDKEVLTEARSKAVHLALDPLCERLLPRAEQREELIRKANVLEQHAFQQKHDAARQLVLQAKQDLGGSDRPNGYAPDLAILQAAETALAEAEKLLPPIGDVEQRLLNLRFQLAEMRRAIGERNIKGQAKKAAKAVAARLQDLLEGGDVVAVEAAMEGIRAEFEAACALPAETQRVLRGGLGGVQ